MESEISRIQGSEITRIQGSVESLIKVMALCTMHTRISTFILNEERLGRAVLDKIRQNMIFLMSFNGFNVDFQMTFGLNSELQKVEELLRRSVKQLEIYFWCVENLSLIHI